VDALLRKHLWIIDLLSVGLCAIFLGRSAASAFEYKFLTAMAIPPPPPRVTRTQTETVYPKQIDTVIKRNVFCSTCPPIVDKTNEVETASETKFEPQKSSLPLQVLAINYAPAPWGFQHSSVVLRDTETKEQYRVRVGQTLGRMRVTQIQPKSVTFTIEEFGYSRQETLMLGDPNKARTQ